MAHIMTCPWCKQKFDIEQLPKEEWVHPNTRYYHIKCWQEKNTPGAVRPIEQDDDEEFFKWRDSIYDFIQRDLKGKCNHSRIAKMMKDYKKEHSDWTYKGMFFALKYFFDIKKNDWSKANGAIGILPSIYYEGTNYWRERTRFDKEIVHKIEQQMEELRQKKAKRISYNQTKKEKHRKALSFEELYNELGDEE